MERRMVATLRDCPARLVPVGTPITIPKDSFVTISQALGGNYTVIVNGNMARVDGTDADALGMKAEVFDFGDADDDGTGRVSEDQVWRALRTVFDPEIPVNIVDLGLVYRVSVAEPDNGKARVDIDMTLTAPACGMGPVLVSDVEYRVGKVPHVGEVNVELVFDPPWSWEMMSEEAQLETGMIY